MKEILAIGAVMAAMAALPAHSQDSNANAAAGSNAQAGSVSGAINSNVFTSPENTNVEIKTTPAVSAPGIVTAFNCGRGYSAGASWMGGGVGIGGVATDELCQLLAGASALNVLAGKRAALHHLASGNVELCRTLRATGHIGAGSKCGDEPEPVAAKLVTPKERPGVAFKRCEKRADGALLVTLKRGADRALAISQCKAIQ